MSISALFDGLCGFFEQIGDFIVMLWNLLTSHLELLGRYLGWMVKSIPELLSFLTQGWNYISKIMVALPSPIIDGIGLLIILPFAVIALKVVSKL